MRFLSIYKNVERPFPPSADEIERMGKLIAEGFQAGYLLAVEGCMPTATGARLRIADGEVTVTDGPFTESKEVIGGFALMQFQTREEAVAYTKKFLEYMGAGSCELRQLYEPPTSSQP